VDTWHTAVGSVRKRVQAIKRRGKGLLVRRRVRVGLEAWGNCTSCEWDTWRAVVDSIKTRVDVIMRRGDGLLVGRVSVRLNAS